MSLPETGPVVERGPDACPSCRTPWPRRAGSCRVGWEGCHGCPGARHGGHRTYTCLTCWIEHFDAPCAKLGGARARSLRPSPEGPPTRVP